MNESSFELLAEGCAHLEAQNTIAADFGGDALSNARDIEDELEHFLGAVFDDRLQQQVEAQETLQPHLMLFDLALLQFCDLAHLAATHLNKARPLFWSELSDETPHPTNVFYLLTSGLSQTLQASRLLMIQAFDAPARTQARSFVELADLTLAVTADQAFYQAYTIRHDDNKEQYQHWRKHLSPAQVRRRLEQLDKELALETKTPVPAHEVRSDTYSWFSLSSHVDLAGHVMAAFPANFEERMGPSAFLGKVGLATLATLRRLLLYTWLFFLHFNELLLHRHNWDTFKNREWYFYRAAVFRTIYESNYNELNGITH